MCRRIYLYGDTLKLGYILPSALVVAAVAVALIIRDGMVRQSEQPKQSIAQSSHSATVQTVSASQHIPSPSRLTASLPKKQDGHYWATARVNNLHVLDFLVDTGASICVLTHGDAKRLGYDFDEMEKDLRINTASGVVYGASLKIERLQIGRVMLKDVDAVVLDDNLKQSLLGMSFLERLNRWEVSKHDMIIHQ